MFEHYINDNFEVIKAKKTGLKHKRLLEPCQDEVMIDMKENRVLAAVADGHGAALHRESATGANIACRGAIDIMEALILRELTLSNDVGNLTNAFAKDFASIICRQWRNAVKEDFSSRCAAVKSAAWNCVYPLYGTTLLCAAVLENALCLAQIGDGVIVLKKKNGELVFPFGKEPASNRTDSLCMGDADERFKIRIRSCDEIDSVLLCTDGVINHYQSDEEFMIFADKMMSVDKELMLPETFDDSSLIVVKNKQK